MVVFSDAPPTVFDPVDRPQHYASGGIEAIEAMEASMSPEAFRGFLKGNVQKYVWRYETKNGLEDLRKAKWYLKLLIYQLEIDEDKAAMAILDPTDSISECKDGVCPIPGARIGNVIREGDLFAPVTKP
jgi:hypothetical protein